MGFIWVVFFFHLNFNLVKHFKVTSKTTTALTVECAAEIKILKVIKPSEGFIFSQFHKDLAETLRRSHVHRAHLCNHDALFAGALPEGHCGRGHRRRTGRKPRPCDHRPRSQRDGNNPLEPDAGHSEEARVHVAPAT